MHPITLIASSIKKDDPDYPELPDAKVATGECCFTGEKTDCIPRSLLLGKSFNNHDTLLRPGSKFASLDAWVCMKYKWERSSSFFCDGKSFDRLNRQGVRDKFFQKELPDLWVGHATTSYKKHGSLLTKTNMSRKNRIWSFEMKLVDASDIQKRDEWWGILNEYLRLGISRPVMESLTINPAYISKIGLDVWVKFERWATDKYQSNLYAFLCYLLPSQDELKAENSVNTTQPEKKEKVPAIARKSGQLELF